MLYFDQFPQNSTCSCSLQILIAVTSRQDKQHQIQYRVRGLPKETSEGIKERAQSEKAIVVSMCFVKIMISNA